MTAVHAKELHGPLLEVLPAMMRHYQEHWVGLLALGIGTIACRLVRSSRRLAGAAPDRPVAPLARAAGRVARRHAAAIGQLVGRLMAAVVLG